jgi:hypothetical protein
MIAADGNAEHRTPVDFQAKTMAACCGWQCKELLGRSLKCASPCSGIPGSQWMKNHPETHDESSYHGEFLSN